MYILYQITNTYSLYKLDKQTVTIIMSGKRNNSKHCTTCENNVPQYLFPKNSEKCGICEMQVVKETCDMCHLSMPVYQFRKSAFKVCRYCEINDAMTNHFVFLGSQFDKLASSIKDVNNDNIKKLKHTVDLSLNIALHTSEEIEKLKKNSFQVTKEQILKHAEQQANYKKKENITNSETKKTSKFHVQSKADPTIPLPADRKFNVSNTINKLPSSVVVGKRKCSREAGDRLKGNKICRLEAAKIKEPPIMPNEVLRKRKLSCTVTDEAIDRLLKSARKCETEVPTRNKFDKLQDHCNKVILFKNKETHNDETVEKNKLSEISRNKHIYLVGDNMIAHQDKEFASKKKDRMSYCFKGETIDEIHSRMKKPSQIENKKTLLITQLGATDIRKGQTNAQILTKYKNLVTDVKRKYSNCAILAILPRAGKNDTFNGRAYIINTLLEKLCKENGLVYWDFWDHFKGKADLYVRDGAIFNQVGIVRLGRLLHCETEKLITQIGDKTHQGN